MIEKVQYINHLNEIIDFGKEGIFVDKSDIHDFSWDVVSKNNRISSFKKGIQSRKLPVKVKSADSASIRNSIFEVCEKDVLAVKPGKLIVGNYYMTCYITESKKSEYLDEQYMKATLTVKTDMPYWIKETIFAFDSSSLSAGKNLDYNNDFAYDYTSNMLTSQIINPNFVASNFKMKIFGVAQSPELYIGGHEYSVSVDISANEYLTIDSTEKTILLTKADGSTVNCFNLRNKDSYIFEKIQPGASFVSTSAEFRFEVTLLEERSEPKWT